MLEKRTNSDFIHPNTERQIYVCESVWESGVSQNMLMLIYDLIQAGLVEKVED